jgi:hypothetical protein
VEIILKVSKDNNDCDFFNTFNIVKNIDINNIKKSISSIICNFKFNTINFTIINVLPFIFDEVCFHIFDECIKYSVVPFIHYQISSLKYLEFDIMYKYDFMIKTITIKNCNLNDLSIYDLSYFSSIKEKTVFELVLDKSLLPKITSISEDLIQWKEYNFDTSLKLCLDKNGIDYTNYHLYILRNQLDLIHQYFIDKLYIPINYNVGYIDNKNEEYCVDCGLSNFWVETNGNIISCGKNTSIPITKYIGRFTICKYTTIDDENDGFKIKYGKFIMNSYCRLFSWRMNF